MNKTEKFIEDARKVHGDRYSYDKTEYINSKTKVTITCADHGDFEQIPTNHKRGANCFKCGKESMSKTKTMSTEQFIARANQVHNGLYTYDNAKYTNIFDKITITCFKHGDFNQTANDHLRGKGCNICGYASGRQLSTTDFIERSQSTHGNRYDYSKSIYVDANNKVIITCSEHGDFEQLPYSHYKNGQGCPKCGTCYGKKENEWLDSFGVSMSKQYKVEINGSFYVVDGYDSKTNTVYEFQGDFWHGNPKLYKSSDFNNVTKTTFGELYEKTVNKISQLKQAGYNVVEIWESEYKS